MFRTVKGRAWHSGGLRTCNSSYKGVFNLACTESPEIPSWSKR